MAVVLPARTVATRGRPADAAVHLAGVLRLLRAGAFAAVCVALTTVGHELAGGATVGPLAIGVGFVALFATGAALARRERSGTTIAAAMLAGQVGLHQVFMAADGPMAGMTDRAPSDHGVMLSGAAMLAVHIGLAAVSGWWLRRGEAACWRLVRRGESGAVAALRCTLRHLAGAPFDPLTEVVGPARPSFRRREPTTRMTSLRVRCEPRRGPPSPRASTAGGRQ